MPAARQRPDRSAVAGVQRLRRISVREAIVVNRSGTRIDVLSMSESSDNDWGWTVWAVAFWTAAKTSGCRSAARVRAGIVYADTRVEEGMNVNLCSDAQVVFDVPVPA